MPWSGRHQSGRTCKDSHTTYFPGISTADDTWTQKELEDIGLSAKQEAKQQYAERQAEKFDRLAKYSLDEENKDKYGAKHDAWSKIVNSSLPIQAIKNPSEHSSKTLDKYFGKSVVKSRDSDIIKKNKNILEMNLQFFGNGQQRAEMYSKNWERASLQNAINMFAKGAEGVINAEKGKIIYQAADGRYRVVYDYNGDYFRIEDTTKIGKRRYVDMAGSDVANITIGGKTRGRTKDEYESITHFLNSDMK